jgi:hypothetical protein
MFNTMDLASSSSLSTNNLLQQVTFNNRDLKKPTVVR